jgi:fructose-1,6-bisphosphatase/inositol monophosphatase family enzyme
MPRLAPDIDAVAALLAEVAERVVLPRFRMLAPGDVEHKRSTGDVSDVVTVADHEAEAELGRRLRDVVPGSIVIGEEAAHRSPQLLSHLTGNAPVWLVDPVDGTRNFVAGLDTFGMMVALVEQGHARAAWILLPARSELFVAEAGGGAWLNGERLQVRGDRSAGAPRGTVHVRYMPEPLRESAGRTSRGRFVEMSDTHCAAVEYTDVLRGRRDFAVYYRLLPWDHVAPALLLSEGGGCTVHLTGQPYVPLSPDQVTVVAAHRETAQGVSAWFLPEDGQRMGGPLA